MDIFVKKAGGGNLGPFTIATLAEALGASEIDADDNARIEGDPINTTVVQLLASAAPPPGEPPPPPAPPERNRVIPSSLPNLPTLSSAAPKVPVPRELSTKLSPPPGGANPNEPPPISHRLKRRRPRRSEVKARVQTERLRMFGATTPFVMGIVLWFPWLGGGFLGEHVAFSGYNVFQSVRAVFGAIFTAGVLGIGWFSFRGAIDGGHWPSGLAFASALLPAGVLGLLSVAPDVEPYSFFFDGGYFSILGGWNFTMATLLIGTSFGIAPSHETTPTAVAVAWFLSGALALIGIILIFQGVGLSVRS